MLFFFEVEVQGFYNGESHRRIAEVERDAGVERIGSRPGSALPGGLSRDGGSGSAQRRSTWMGPTSLMNV